MEALEEHQFHEKKNAIPTTLLCFPLQTTPRFSKAV